MLGCDETAVAQDGGALEDVVQLSDVARPVVLEESLPHLSLNARGRAAEGPSDLFH